MEKQLTIPTVHLNGSSGESLFEGYCKAVEALSAAIEACRNTAPHGRDYYVKDITINTAIKEHADRLRSLHTIRDEFKTLAMAVSRQQREREERKMK